MQKNKFLKYIGGLLVLGIIFLFGVSVGKENYSQKNTASSSNQTQAGKVSLMIDYGNEKIETFEDLPISENTNVFEILKSVSEKNKLSFLYKDYGGSMGVFIESIGGIGKDPSGKKWWQFWVNNKYSNVGVSGYILKPGDIVLLKFFSGQQ